MFDKQCSIVSPGPNNQSNVDDEILKFRNIIIPPTCFCLVSTASVVVYLKKINYEFESYSIYSLFSFSSQHSYLNFVVIFSWSFVGDAVVQFKNLKSLKHYLH